MIRKKFRVVFSRIKYRSAKYIIFLIFFVSTLTAIFNLVPLQLYIWAFRNTFRFFVFFAACVTVLDTEDIDGIFDILYKFQYLNIVLCLLEYFVWGYKQDCLGGIFGIERRCNGAQNIYFCILLTWALSKYLAKKLNIIHLLVVMLSVLIISALAELKIFYIEFVLIVIMVVFLSRPSFKLGIIIAVGFVGFNFSLDLLKEVFPHQYNVLVNTNTFLDYFNSSGTGGYNISRMSAFKEINDRFFNNSVIRNLFGYGFGACEYSSFSLFTSQFYKQYSALNYRIFAHVMIFLETGYVGLILFILFFIDAARYAILRIKELGIYRYHAIIAIVFSMMCIINLWYNNALKIEYSYMAYFVLAIVAIDIRTIYERRR